MCQSKIREEFASRPVLYLKDAYEVFTELTGTNTPLEKLPEFKLMRQASTYFWVVVYQDLEYIIKLGFQSTIEVCIEGTKPMINAYGPMIDIKLKDCSIETNEKTNLWVRCSFQRPTKEICVNALYIEGKDIENFPHTYWKEYCIRFDDNTDDGCIGRTYSLYRHKDGELYRLPENPTDTKISLWSGKKYIRIYNPEEYPSIYILKIFWNNFVDDFLSKKNSAK